MSDARSGATSVAPDAAHRVALGTVNDPERSASWGVDADLLGRADALRPLLEANAARCEETRRIPDENLEALESAGLFDLMAPARVGGVGASLATQLAASASLARGCPSTAWIQTIFAGSRWWVGTLASPEAQQEVLCGPERPLVSGVLGASGPSGTAVPAPGGYLVFGRWPFASGCLHANWSILGVAFPGESGDAADEGIVIAPLGELAIQDTWHVAGMCGTGSNTLVADGVFVPETRAVRGDVLLGTGPRTGGEPSDRWPTLCVLALILLGPVLGTARELVQLVADGARRRGISYSTYERQTDSMVVVRDLARASLDLDTAWLHVMRAAADVDATGRGHAMDPLARARLRGSCGYVGGLLRGTAGSVLDIAGASAFANANPLQRQWRDLNTASRHALLATQPMLELYGRAMFDLDAVFGPT